jgi:hypothetical protein
VTAQLVIAAGVPIIVALVGGFFGFRQAIKVADRNAKAEAARAEKAAKAETAKAKTEAKTESERLNLETYESLNRALMAEIDRLRADHVEDRQQLTARLAENTEACEQVRLRLVRVTAWTEAVLRILQHPAIAATVAEHRIEIPPPPVEE